MHIRGNVSFLAQPSSITVGVAKRLAREYIHNTWREVDLDYAGYAKQTDTYQWLAETENHNFNVKQ